MRSAEEDAMSLADSQTTESETNDLVIEEVSLNFIMYIILAQILS